MAKCGEKTEIYSRVCGYFRPVSNWNKGKKEEFKERLPYNPDSELTSQRLELTPPVVRAARR
jgi:ribonucleoside-triphosphate reductase